MPPRDIPLGAYLAAHEHQGLTHCHISLWSPTLHRFCGIPSFHLQDPLLHGALCPAPPQPCLAWRQAALREFSALETSGISLGVSQNSPSNFLQLLHTSLASSWWLYPEHPPQWRWQGCRWDSPRSWGIPHPYNCRECGSFFNAEIKQ